MLHIYFTIALSIVLCIILYLYNITYFYGIIIGILLYMYLCIDYNICYNYMIKKSKEKKYVPHILDTTTSSILVPGKIISYKEFITCDIPDSTSMIPKIIFRLSYHSFDSLPESIRTALDDTSKVCSDYTQVYLDDKDGYDFVKTYYPQYLDNIQSLIPGAFRSDVFRLLLLYHYGGVYNDIGHTYIKPISDWLPKHYSLILSRDLQLFSLGTSFTNHGIYNAFMASYKQHPILYDMITFVIDNITYKRYGIMPTDITGPKALLRAFNRFQRKPEHSILPMGRSMIRKNNISYRIYIIEATLDQFVPKIKDIKTNQYVIKNKFDNYKKVMYSTNNIPRYTKLWFYRCVYSNHYH